MNWFQYALFGELTCNNEQKFVRMESGSCRRILYSGLDRRLAAPRRTVEETAGGHHSESVTKCLPSSSKF